MDRKTALRNFISSSLLYGKPPAFSDTASLQNEGVVDSTGLMTLVAFVEETYNVKVDDEDLLPENFDSIDGIDGFIARKLAGRNA